MKNENQKMSKTFEELGWYVYALVYPKAYTKKHPNEKGIFYIGKGIHNRVLQHVKEAETTKSKTEKLDTIRKIVKEGFSVDYYILRHQIPTEEEAYRIESVCIDLLSYKDFEFSCLKNDVTGHGENEFGIKTLGELVEQYGNLPTLQITDDSELLCICINKYYGIDDEDGNPVSIYDAVRGSWTITPEHANKCKYVIAEYHGISRGVFKVNKKGWQKCNDSKRYFFEGIDVSETEGKKYMNCILPEKKKGHANPCRYLSKNDCVEEKEKTKNYKKHSVIAICVNRTYGQINEKGHEIDAYNAVCGCWKVSPDKANNYEYIIAEYHGKCVGVFVTDEKGWRKSNLNPERYFFKGKRASSKIYNQYIDMELPPREKGSSNPIRYFDEL